MHIRKPIIFSLLIILLFSLGQSFGQTVPNFTVTDADGVEHNLYEDYLDKGITVAFKIFFIGCPPCTSIAPDVQAAYEEWGSGEYDVQFIEFSNRENDLNASVDFYQNNLNLTFPGVGFDGGALDALEPYLSGTFGPGFGTPIFAVIAPDRTVNYNTGGNGNSGRIANLNAAISATGAIGAPNVPEPHIINFSLEDAFGTSITGLNITLSDGNNASISYAIDSSVPLSITDLTTEYPGISNPVLHFSKEDGIRDRIAPLDILLIRKHILNIIPISNPDMLTAADTNGDGIITPLDMLVLQKVILGIFTTFPINSYQIEPNQLPLTITPGESTNLTLKAIKIGDLNGF